MLHTSMHVMKEHTIADMVADERIGCKLFNDRWDARNSTVVHSGIQC